ncbi:hypothetical protein OIO90_001303 [Microbotryomycetes sp. JL221]|nr:hypothetical protein OIO90_001303 [Microbotryomycetes sp. JL221]
MNGAATRESDGMARQQDAAADPLPHGLPVRFSNLAVPESRGQSGNEALVTTLGSALLDVVTLGPAKRAAQSLLGWTNDDRDKCTIAGIEGIVDQGEMLLIVGPPSSHASTLLRALTSPSDLPMTEFTRIDYGLLPPSAVKRPRLSLTKQKAKNAGILRSQIVFMSEHDVHFALLSVKASMMPASLAKAPSGQMRPDGVGRRQWATTRLNKLVEAMGLGHAMDTKVGSPLVRGLSGGERKRASIVESLLTRAAVLCLDAPTSGLDSSTALSVLSYLRKWARDGKRSVIATAPAISDPLFQQFDKVLVLNSQGRQVYFGRTSEVQKYYEGLGLGFNRRIDKGEDVVEGNDIELERAWLKSDARQQLTDDMEGYSRRYPFKQCAGPLLSAIKKEKSWAAWSHYNVSYLYQVAILTRRQYSLIASELPGYVTKTTVNLLLSVTVGSLFWRLPTETTGAFTRGSLLLLAIMFNAYLSLAELGKAIEGRDIVKRQGEWGFFGSSALALARVAGDLPLIGAQCLLFGSVTYTMAGLRQSISAFATYILFVYATALNLSSMFRMFAAFSPGFEEAIRFCGICLNILVLYAGYFIPTYSMRSGLKWIHYVIDPISYSYEAVLANEFHNLRLECSATDIVPRGPSYNDSRFQTCLLAGSEPGSLEVLGDRYLEQSFDFHYDRIWFNLGIMAVQAFVFLIIGVVATEFLHFAPGGTKRLWARTQRVKLRLARRWYKNEDQEDGSAFSLAPIVEDGIDVGSFADDDNETTLEGAKGSTLLWRNLCLWVDTPTDTRRLLDHVCGYIKPGRVCALMGASGAGKSTLLNVLAGRKIGVVRGKILVDGLAPDDVFYRTTGFVEQFDLHDDRSTVREALEFSALLRQDDTISKEDKLAYVDEVLDLLDLTALQDAIIGTAQAGLNAEQRKRVTIAVEVVSKPAILFCDEPTTGLDTESALRVVKLLRRLSRTGLAVICTIHQPSAETFSVFDDLLLLQRGGRSVYFGPRADAVGYFTDQGLKQKQLNPADFLLDITGAGIDVPEEDTASNASDVDRLHTNWKTSPRYKQLTVDLDGLAAPENAFKRGTILAASVWTQSVELTKRVTRNYYRDPSFSYTKIFTSTVVPLIIGLSFFGVGREQTIVSLQNRMFSTFLLLFVPVVWLNVIIFKMFRLRGLWEARERPSKIYGRVAFVTSLLVSEVPYSILCGFAYWILWYFLTGFPLRAGTIFFTFLLVQIFFMFQSTWALWIVGLSQQLGTIANLLPFFLVSMEAFNGALMPFAQMPVYWKWLYYISPFQHYVRSMLGVLLHGVKVVCQDSELVQFFAPQGQTCAGYVSDYLSTNPGYLFNPEASDVCQFCKVSTGDEYLHDLNISYDDRWASLGILCAYTVSNVALAYLFVFYPPTRPQWLKLKQSSRMTAEQVASETYERELAEQLTLESRAPL